jgi:nucleotide-binding universal stress UspA family protein
MEIKNILLPTDFSDKAKIALPFAIDLAKKYGAKLHVIHVFDESAFDPAFFSTSEDTASNYFEKVQAGFQKEIEKIFEGQDYGGVNIITVLSNGNAFVKIIEYAKTNAVDLIVMGTHGRSGLSSIFMGSVTEKVIHKAHCPVLTVRHPDYEFEPI